MEFWGGRRAARAIFSETAKAFAEELQALSNKRPWQRFDFGKMVETQIYPIRPWLFTGQAESTFRELMFYFDRMRNVAVTASREGRRLFFRCYEDW